MTCSPGDGGKRTRWPNEKINALRKKSVKKNNQSFKKWHAMKKINQSLRVYLGAGPCFQDCEPGRSWRCPDCHSCCTQGVRCGFLSPAKNMTRAGLSAWWSVLQKESAPLCENLTWQLSVMSLCIGSRARFTLKVPYYGKIHSISVFWQKYVSCQWTPEEREKLVIYSLLAPRFRKCAWLGWFPGLNTLFSEHLQGLFCQESC